MRRARGHRREAAAADSHKGLPGPGLLVQTVVSKHGDYLPLYRQEDILSRGGIIIRRSTLCDWVASAADLLQPLYDLMCDCVRASHVIHTADTGIKMLAVGQCRNCKFWAAAWRMPVTKAIRTRSTNPVVAASSVVCCLATFSR
jgi:hypothetical protein